MYPYLELIFTKTLPYKFPRHRTGEYPNGSQCFKPMFIGVHQLKPETLPNLFQEPVKSPLIPKHCAFFPKIGIEGERPSVQKASFRIQNGRIRTLSNPAPFFPKRCVWSVSRGIIIQSILFQPISDVESPWKWWPRIISNGLETPPWFVTPRAFSFTHRCYQCLFTDWYDCIYCAGLSGKTLNDSVVGMYLHLFQVPAPFLF